MKKGILALSLGVCLMLSLFGLPFPTQADSVTVSIEDVPATANCGDAFTTTVAISNVVDLNAACFELVFDHTVLQFDPASVTDGLINGTVLDLFAAVKVEDGRWRIIEDVHGLAGATGSGHLCKFDFTVIGSAGESSDINLENGSLSDTVGDYIIATWTGATVNVGAPTAPTIAFSPTSFTFSATEGGANPADQTLEIWNSGTGTLDWSVSDDAAWLSLSPTSGSSTGEHDPVTVSVDITGMSAGDYSATITISAPGATNTPQTVLVSLHISAAPEPDISVDPTSKDFGDVTVDSSSSAETFTVSNVGTANLVVGTITITGANANQFSNQNDNCSGQTIPPSSSGTLQVVFSPTSTGAKSATLEVPSNDPDEATVTVSLSGNGVTAPTYYTLTVTCDPTDGGSVTLDPSQPPGGYEAGTTVTLTANAASGYAFGSWSGALTGSTNPDTIAMNSNKSVTANFVVFSAPANVDVSGADPTVENIEVTTKDLTEVDTTNIPEDVDAQEAYVVDSTGTGSFTLRFTNVANASNIVVYKVVDTTWTQIPATAITVIDATTVEVTMGVGDPVLVFGLPTGAPPPPPPVGGTAFPENTLTILAPWIALGAAIIAGAAIFIRRRRAHS